MPTIMQAGSNETPDTSGLGGIAVTGNSNTGFGDTTSSVSIGSEQTSTQTKTARWFNFPSQLAATRRLQFDWALSGTITLTGAAPDTTIGSVSLLVEYTVDGGSNWSTALSQSFSRNTSGTTTPSDSGSVDLGIGQGNASAVQVRGRVRASATSTGDPTVSATADITASVSGLQLSVEQSLSNAPIVIL